MEALKWFRKYKDIQFAPNAFISREEAVKCVKKLQKLGAKVEIPWDSSTDSEDDFDYYHDEMIIEMPTTLTKKFDVAMYIHSKDGFPFPDDISVDSSAGSYRQVDWKKDKRIVFWWD